MGWARNSAQSDHKMPNSSTDTALRSHCTRPYFAYLIVVHHSVHGLDPHSVNIAVKDDPLVRLIFVEPLGTASRASVIAVVNKCFNVRFDNEVDSIME